MKKRIVGTCLMVAAASLLPVIETAPAQAATDQGGASCIAMTEAQNSIAYDAFGARNTSASPASVICSKHIDNCCVGCCSPTIRLNLYDRHASQDISCTFWQQEESGNPFFTAGLSTTGFQSPVMVKSRPMAFGGGHVTMQCSLPAFNAQNGFSHLAHYTW
jgi:hypothetical protein